MKPRWVYLCSAAVLQMVCVWAPGVVAGYASQRLRPGAVEALRLMLEAVGTENAGLYRPHDLRRGHAEDLRLSGAPLWKILAAGEWKSPAFLTYMDLHKLEMDLVLQGHLDEESDCDAD